MQGVHSPHRTKLVVVAAIVVLLALLGDIGRAHAVLLEGEFSDAASRREGHNPTLGSKLVGYTRLTDAAGHPPDIVILGTSRAVQLDPRLIKQLSGKTAYNASTSDGAAREYLAFGSFVELLTPDDPPHIVLMFDIEGLDRRTPTKRVTEVLAATDAARKRCIAGPECAAGWRRAARSIVRDAAIGIRDVQPASHTQRPDGMQINGGLEKLDRQGVDLAPMRNRRIGIRIDSYRPGGGFDRLMPIPQAAIRRMLELANARGDEPTIVITSMHPDCIRRCGPAGWNQRHRDAVAFLRTLQKRYQFELLDYANPAAWGGGAGSFFDEIHLRPAAAAKLVRKLNAVGAFDVDVDPKTITPEIVPASPNEGFFAMAFARMTRAAST